MISIQQITYLNEIGQREQLEDTIYPAPAKAELSDKLFLVCDGVGGENMGEQASRIACQEFAHFFLQNPPPAGRPLNNEYIKGAQQHVLQQMRSYAARHPEAEKMSTTLTLAYFSGDTISVAWCGDSRVYHLRGGEVRWRSSDHSLVENLVRHGEITPEEARRHPQRNIITRALSAHGTPSEIDHHIITDLRGGDYLMLCTDGVLEQIDEDRLRKITLSQTSDKKALLLEYCAGLTRDNYSLYLLKIGNDKAAPLPAKDKKTGMLIALILALLCLSAILLKDQIRILFTHAGHDHGKAIIKKAPPKRLGPLPAEEGSKKAAAKGPGTGPLGNPERKDSAGGSMDTVKGFKVSISSERIKVSAAVARAKKAAAGETKKSSAAGSTGTNAAPPQNPD